MGFLEGVWGIDEGSGGGAIHHMYTPSTVRRTVYAIPRIHCTLYSVQCTVYIVHCTI